MIIAIIQPNDIKQIPIIVYEIDNKVFGKRNVTVLITTLFTIILFASYTSVKDIFGDIGIVALCFVTFMFGTGILSEVLDKIEVTLTLIILLNNSILGRLQLSVMAHSLSSRWW